MTASIQTDFFDSKDFAVDWRDVTHAGGKGECLHDWYAYLEGYSSEFVRSIRSTYLFSAKTIIDPFAGSGTTPIALGLDGVQCSYCELNPVMRKVITAKQMVAALPETKKIKLSKQLFKLADQLPSLAAAASPNRDLRTSYSSAFKNSEFFFTEAFEKILALRALNDQLFKSEYLLGASLQVAVMAKLVECSKLKRAGDLRFKTEKELSNGVPEVFGSVVKQLQLMAEDCLRCPQLRSEPKLLSNNAKDLLSAPSIGADGVITSPPYLNGTNYFRNTKLELWYSRELIGPECLRRYRDEVITSGINDVTKAKGNTVLAHAKEVHDQLQKVAYDKRIAKMVAGYFEEMSITLKGLSHQLQPRGVACIDIGDSVYAGIHVKTHEILASISEANGFKVQDIVTLRERRSYDGTRLTQSLLVLERFGSTTRNAAESDKSNVKTQPKSLSKWVFFKESLPHLHHPYSKRNWGNSLHSVCSYQGKMKPSLAYHLVDTFSAPGDTVFDPFSGSGTIPFEAALNGRKTFGLDISVLATVLSNAKLMPSNNKSANELINSLEAYIETNEPSKHAITDCSEVSFNKTIPDYFHKETLREILCARDFFGSKRMPNDPAWALVFSCMLHILHGNRPYALSRRSHPITPYAPSGEFEYRSLIDRLRTKVQKSLDTDRGPSFVAGECFKVDVLAKWPKKINQIDAIITSPPFFDSTRFFMTNWMRYWFCGWGRQDFESQPASFIETIQRKNLDAYDPIFRQCHERLRTGGFAVFHLGHSDKCDMAKELKPAAEKYFKMRDLFVESVEHCENHGIKDKGRVKNHQYLVLEKTG